METCSDVADNVRHISGLILHSLLVQTEFSIWDVMYSLMPMTKDVQHGQCRHSARARLFHPVMSNKESSLKKMNLKRRAIFYLGLLLAIFGVMQLPVNFYSGSVLAGLLKFLSTALIAVPIILIAAYVAPAKSTFLGVRISLLSTITSAIGLIVFLSGIFVSDGNLIKWGVFVMILGGEISLLSIPRIDETSAIEQTVRKT